MKVPCSRCGVIFDEYPCKVKRAVRHYCTRVCHAKARVGIGNPNWRGGSLSRQCQNCGKAFTIIQAGVKRNRGNYCSFECGRLGIRVHATATAAKRFFRRKRENILRASRKLEKFHTDEEWNALLAKHGGRCVICGSTKRIERDHIIPLSKGGTDDIGNIQPLCKTCNCRKNNRTQ